jgi:Ca2+-binding EF-hand superfamily protein
MNPCRYKPPDKDTVLAAFEVLDTEGKGFFTVEDMSRLVTQCGGEPLSAQDLDEMLTAATTVNHDGSQVIKYAEYADSLVVQQDL